MINPYLGRRECQQPSESTLSPHYLMTTTFFNGYITESTGSIP